MKKSIIFVVLTTICSLTLSLGLSAQILVTTFDNEPGTLHPGSYNLFSHKGKAYYLQHTEDSTRLYGLGEGYHLIGTYNKFYGSVEDYVLGNDQLFAVYDFDKIQVISLLTGAVETIVESKNVRLLAYSEHRNKLFYAASIGLDDDVTCVYVYDIDTQTNHEIVRFTRPDFMSGHYGMVGDKFYCSIDQYECSLDNAYCVPVKSSVLRYNMIPMTTDTIAYAMAGQSGDTGMSKYVYGTWLDSSTVRLHFIGNRSMVYDVHGVTKHSPLFANVNHENKLVVQLWGAEALSYDGDTITIYDGEASDSKRLWTQNRFIDMEYSDASFANTYYLQVEDKNYDLMKFDNSTSFVVVNNGIYVREIIGMNSFESKSKIWHYDLCNNTPIVQGTTNEISYKAGEAWKSHQKLEGSVLYEPSRSVLLLPGFEADASQGDVFEAKIWNGGCSND